MKREYKEPKYIWITKYMLELVLNIGIELVNKL